MGCMVGRSYEVSSSCDILTRCQYNVTLVHTDVSAASTFRHVTDIGAVGESPCIASQFKFDISHSYSSQFALCSLSPLSLFIPELFHRRILSFLSAGFVSLLPRLLLCSFCFHIALFNFFSGRKFPFSKILFYFIFPSFFLLCLLANLPSI